MALVDDSAARAVATQAVVVEVEAVNAWTYSADCRVTGQETL